MGAVRLKIACVAMLMAGVATAASARDLTVVSFGGSLQDAIRAAFITPFVDGGGAKVIEDTYDGALSKITAQVETGATKWDVIDVESNQLLQGCQEGAFEQLDHSKLGDLSKVLPAAKDFSPCGVGFLTGAQVLVYDKAKLADGPKTWADFWDVKKFPGRRAMHNDSEAQLEMALMADGVAPKDVYSVLSSPEGLKRAIDKLAELKPNIAVWWSSGSQSQQIMKDNEVDMAVMWNGRSEGLKAGGAPVDYTFNEGILSQDCWAVPADAPHKAAAMKLLNEMSKPEPQANFSVMVKYGPLNMKAYATGLISDATAAKFPSFPANAEKMVVQSGSWWAENTAKADAAFDDMMNN